MKFYVTIITLAAGCAVGTLGALLMIGRGILDLPPGMWADFGAGFGALACADLCWRYFVVTVETEMAQQNESYGGDAPPDDDHDPQS